MNTQTLDNQIKPKRGFSRKSQRNFWGWVFVIPAIVIFVTFTVVPIYLGITLSFTNVRNIRSFINNNYNYVAFNNFKFVFQSDHRFWLGMKNIALYTIVTVPLTLTGSMILALIVKKPIKGTKFFRGVFYLPGITSGVATAMVWSFLLNGSHGVVNILLDGVGLPKILLNQESTALWGIILMTLWGALGGNMVLFLAGMNAIPDSIYEAAEVDGANRIQRFFKITLPLMRPSIFFALTLSLIGTPQMFEPVLLMGARTTTPVFEIYTNAMSNNMLARATSQSILLFMAIMVITFVMQRVQKENYF